MKESLMNPELAKKIELIVMDVDGVMTPGDVMYPGATGEIKTFNTKDGAGMKYWTRAGGRMAWITGRKTDAVARRAKNMGCEELRQGVKAKLPVLEEVLETMGIAPEHVCVIGDDLTDLPMMYPCGMSACPGDAVGEVKEYVDYVCTLPGGRSCVRELIEVILKSSGRWDQIMERYLPPKE